MLHDDGSGVQHSLLDLLMRQHDGSVEEHLVLRARPQTCHSAVLCGKQHTRAGPGLPAYFEIRQDCAHRVQQRRMY